MAEYDTFLIILQFNEASSLGVLVYLLILGLSRLLLLRLLIPHNPHKLNSFNSAPAKTLLGWKYQT